MWILDSVRWLRRMQRVATAAFSAASTTAAIAASAVSVMVRLKPQHVGSQVRVWKFLCGLHRLLCASSCTTTVLTIASS